MEQTIQELQNLGLQIDEDRGFAPNEIRVKLFKALYSDEGKVLLGKFRKEYEETFGSWTK